MAAVVLDVNAVGQVVTYVAPGFLAYIGYRTRYPSSHRPASEVLLISVVLSLPLVALARLLLTGIEQATELGYVAVLLGLGFGGGYLTALVRERVLVKRWLARLGYRIQPEGTIYAHTLQHMSEDGAVTVELKSGRRISGTPRNGPQCKEDGINELYLTYARTEGEGGEWLPIGGPAVIVPLSEVNFIVLSEEPTGAPEESAEAKLDERANGRVRT